MSNKKQKAQDHIPIQDMNGNFVAFGHPGFLRKLSKVDRGFFQKSLTTLETSFVLNSAATPENYPELSQFLKDNIVSQEINQVDTTTSSSSATNVTTGTLKFNASIDQKIREAQNQTVEKVLGIMAKIASEAAEIPDPEEELGKYGKMLKNLPSEVRDKLLYGDFPDKAPPSTSANVGLSDVDIKAIKESMREAIKDSRKITGEINGVKFGVDEAVPGADQTVLVGYGPSKEQKVFSEAEQKAYFSEFNARHRYLQNINVEVLKSNMGETEYVITADYRGDITVYQYFKCHIRCVLTLAEYSDNLVFKDSVWKSVHIEKWLGTYHANYSEWEDILDKGQEGADNRAVHPENRKELETNWQQFYHDLPLEAINAMMNFDPRGLTDKTYSSK